MKKRILLITAFFVGVTAATAQVGINTTDPKTTLHVIGVNDKAAVAATDGLLVPRVNALAVNGAEDGQLVFLIADAGTFKKGFHYWNVDTTTPANSAWVPITDAEAIAGAAEVRLVAGNNLLSSKAGIGVNGTTISAGDDTANSNRGEGNIAFGQSAGDKMTSGVNNIFLGTEAGGDAVSPGDSNMFMGYFAGRNAESPNGGNIGLGESSFRDVRNEDNSPITGNSNIAIGGSSLQKSRILSHNTAIGTGAGNDSEFGEANVLIGKEVARATDGTGDPGTFSNFDDDNIIMGTDAAVSATGSSANVLLGKKVANIATIGNHNIIQGSNALQGSDDGTTKTFATAGDENIIIGKDAAVEAAIDEVNIVIGRAAGKGAKLTEHSNVLIGNLAGRYSEMGQGNHIAGWLAANGTQTTSSGVTTTNRTKFGDYNLFMGSRVMQEAYAGQLNVVLGPNSGFGANLQDYNVLIGHSSAVGQDVGDNNIVIGNVGLPNANGGTTTPTGNVYTPLANESNQLNIQNIIFGTGNDSRNSATASADGKLGIGQPAPTERLDVAGTAKANNFMMNYQVDGTVDANSGFVNATSNVALPTAATFKAGKLLYIKNTSAASINVTPNGSETIDGVTGARPITTYQTLVLISTGTTWLEVSEM